MKFGSALATACLLLCGCGKDDKALDAFSHAYTDFENAAFDADIDGQLFARTYDPFHYWEEVKGAIDVRGTDGSRFEHAAIALNKHGTVIAEALERYAGDIEKMNKLVLRLVELANTMQNLEFRADAIRVAKFAREAHSALASMYDLWFKRLELDERVLEEIVIDQGVVSGKSMFVRSVEQVKSLRDGMEAAAQRSKDAWGPLRDAFSALKGKSNLPHYPTKEELEEKSTQE